MLKFTPSRRLKGGVRLPAHKAQSTTGRIGSMPTPDRLILSTRQHQGPAATPVVNVGDRVLKGQTIATSDSVLGAQVHAPTSGQIIAIETRDVPLFAAISRESCIVLEPDRQDEALADKQPHDEAMQAEQSIRQLAAAGIVGLGGAVYPTAAKLLSTQNSNPPTLIINGAECEPYISCDDMLMREAADEILAGAVLIRDLIGADRCVVAIERDKPQAIDAMTAAAEKLNDDRISIAELPSIYPAGGERQLVDVLAGKEVPSGSVPGQYGCVVQNVGTAQAVWRWINQREPLIRRVVTVTGSAIKSPQNIEALIGTPIADLIAACGGYQARAERLIQGGSMMGFALPGDDLPVTKATNCIIAAAPGELKADLTEWPCIRCGECALVCPARLQPQDLILAARARDSASLETLGLSECIDCGSCDVVCPSHIPLTREFHEAKYLLQEYLARRDFSKASDDRFQRREVRRDTVEQAVNRRRDEILASLKKPETRSDEILAAVERARERKKTQDE